MVAMSHGADKEAPGGSAPNETPGAISSYADALRDRLHRITCEMDLLKENGLSLQQNIFTARQEVTVNNQELVLLRERWASGQAGREALLQETGREERRLGEQERRCAEAWAAHAVAGPVTLPMRAPPAASTAAEASNGTASVDTHATEGIHRARMKSEVADNGVVHESVENTISDNADGNNSSESATAPLAAAPAAAQAPLTVDGAAAPAAAGVVAVSGQGTTGGSTLREREQEQRQRLVVLETSRSKLIAAVGELREVAKQESGEIGQLRMRIEALRKESGALRSGATAASEGKRRSHSRLETLSASASTSQQKQHSLERQVEELQSEVQTLRSELSAAVASGNRSGADSMSNTGGPRCTPVQLGVATASTGARTAEDIWATNRRLQAKVQALKEELQRQQASR